MAAPYYPVVNLGALASLFALRQQMDAHEDYLDNEGCPYDTDTREKLRKIMAKQVIEVQVPGPERIIEKRIEVATKAAAGGGKRGAKPKLKDGGVKIDDVAKEIEDIRAELKNLKMNSKGLQTGDQIQIIKTRAALVEKMLGYAERASNAKRMSLFQSIVMGILDDLMPEADRQAFMERLEPFASAE